MNFKNIRSSLFSLPVLAGILVVAIVYLMVSSFWSQLDLQKSSLSQLSYKTDSYAKSLIYFYGERLKDVTNLSQQTELKTYYDNLALGMTPEYGLTASIINIEGKFNRFIEENTIQMGADSSVQPIYISVFLLEKDGRILAKSSVEDSIIKSIGEDFLKGIVNNTEKATIRINPTGEGATQKFREFVLVPYSYKGEHKGQIVAEITESLFLNRFVKGSGYILSFGGIPIGLGQCPSCEAGAFTFESFKNIWEKIRSQKLVTEFIAPSGADFFGVHAEITKTPYQLVKLSSRKEVLGTVSPWVLLVGMSFLLILIAVGAVVNIRNQAQRIAAERKAKVLVDNMRQSLFSISSNSVIVEPVSRYSETIFGANIVGQNLFDVLYKDLKNQQEAAGAIQTAVSTVFGEDELQWMLMESNFPHKIKFNSPAKSSEQSERILKIETSPIWNKEEKLEQILFVVEDITSLEALEKEVGEHKQQAALLGDIIRSKATDLRDFFDQFRKSMKDIRSLAQDLNEQSFSTILRDLHTLKGSARLFKLGQLSEQIHNSESELARFKKNEVGNNIEAKESILSELIKIEFAIGRYIELFEKIYPSQGMGLSKEKSSDFAIDQLGKIIEGTAGLLPQKDYLRLRSAVKRLSFKSLRESAEKFEVMVLDISNQLKKKVQYRVEGDALVDSKQYSALSDCILHLVRNSIDHGLEDPNERLQKNKPEVGEIKIQFVDEIDTMKIIISDDGRGIDADRVVEKAIKSGLIETSSALRLSHKEKINLIFSPGFSTKESVTEISGRGIGMDVVKNSIESLSGELKIDTQVGVGSTFMITLRAVT